MRVQVIGLCRFSYLGGRGFQVEHDSFEERRAFLYDPDRLARRWHWFETVTLPALMAQTDPDFTLVMMTGPDLPEPWLGKLRDLEAEIPQFRLSLVRPMHFHLQACKHALMPFIEAEADVIAHFRQDDDDAVAVDYVAHARKDFRKIRPIYRMNQRASIDYMRGVVLQAGEDGVTADPRLIHNASVALTVYLPPDDPRSAVHFPHWRLGNHMPGANFPDKAMFCRSITGDNDSGAIGPNFSWDNPPEDMASLLQKRFRIDATRLGLTG